MLRLGEGSIWFSASRTQRRWVGTHQAMLNLAGWLARGKTGQSSQGEGRRVRPVLRFHLAWVTNLLSVLRQPLTLSQPQTL